MESRPCVSDRQKLRHHKINWNEKKAVQLNIVGEVLYYGMQLRLCVQIDAVRFSRRCKKRKKKTIYSRGCTRFPKEF